MPRAGLLRGFFSKVNFWTEAQGEVWQWMEKKKQKAVLGLKPKVISDSIPIFTKSI